MSDRSVRDHPPGNGADGLVLCPPLRLGIDIGGTFTDVQVLEESTGRTASLKTATTPDDPARGLVAGARLAAQRFGFDLGAVRTLMHGTTIATNAVLEGKLPPGALITTAGFEDILEIGRHVRREIYSAVAEPRTLLIPRAYRFGLAERTRADGSVELAPEPIAIDDLLDRAVATGAKSIAVCFLHGYANQAHEQLVLERARQRFPDLCICASHEVSPELREFERTSTTALNALLMPVVGVYIKRLETGLRNAGFNGSLYLFQSNGGVMGPAQAAALPVRLLLSGPAGGALATQTQGATLEEPNLIGVDMGGTSFDVCVVHAGQTREVAQSEVAGCPVRVPMTEIRTISAGGGSIARVGEDGRLRVGPDSAGAVPGPACYGQTGTWPTVTDANVVLGRLAPAHFLGGNMALDAKAAAEAIRHRVAVPFGMQVETAAAGVLRVAVVQMAAAIRLSLFEKGLDPRDFALFSYGGAGGLHAAEVAAELGCRRVIYPPESATLSAWGMLYADVVHDFAATRRWRTDGFRLVGAQKLDTHGPRGREGAAVLDTHHSGAAGADLDTHHPGPEDALLDTQHLGPDGAVLDTHRPGPDEPSAEELDTHDPAVGSLDTQQLRRTIQTLVAQATERLRAEGFPTGSDAFSLSADMRYPGQAYEIGVPWSGVDLRADDVIVAVERFHALHEAQFAHCDRDASPEVLTWRVRAVGTLTRPRASASIAAVPVLGPSGTRQVYLGNGWHAVPVTTRAALASSGSDTAAQHRGPLIVEDGQTTIFVPGGWVARALPDGTLLAEQTQAARPDQRREPEV